MGDRVAAFAAFEDWTRQVEADGLPLLRLRPKADDLETAFDGDYDYIFDQTAFDAIVATASRSCSQHDVALLIDQDAPHKRRLWFVTEDADCAAILVELWPHAELRMHDGAVGGVAWSHLAELRKDSRQLQRALAMMYVTHLHYKSKDLEDPEVRERLQLLQASLTAAGAANAAAVVTSLFEGDADVTAARDAALADLAALGISPRALPRVTVRRIRRAIRRRVRAGSASIDVVPIVGPDGSGKTALIDALLANENGAAKSLTHRPFKWVFRSCWPIRALYRLPKHRRGTDEMVRRNLIDERHTQLVLMCALSYWPVARWNLARKQPAESRRAVVLMDRYFWDYQVRVRNPGESPHMVRFVKLWSLATPIQDRTVVLLADPDTIVGRRDELTVDAIRLWYETMWSHISRAAGGQVLVVPAAGSLRSIRAYVQRFLTY